MLVVLILLIHRKSQELKDSETIGKAPSEAFARPPRKLPEGPLSMLPQFVFQCNAAEHGTTGDPKLADDIRDKWETTDNPVVHKIQKLLGTPTEKQWPGVSSLRDWHVYPHWEAQSIERHVASLGADGVDLLSKMLIYNPAERISAKAALDHPFFDSLDKSQF